MRTNRYRCWDNDNKTWINLADIDISLKADTTSLGRWYVIKTFKGKETELRNLLFMEYTGLYDDAGDEICEADIVFAKKSASNLNGYYMVVWDSLRGKWAYRSHKVVESFQVGKAGNAHCKIVGNLHDDPNLNHRLSDS
jgi:uncharacterized phage protein (TIGR01671 family)